MQLITCGILHIILPLHTQEQCVRPIINHYRIEGVTEQWVELEYRKYNDDAKRWNEKHSE